MLNPKKILARIMNNKRMKNRLLKIAVLLLLLKTFATVEKANAQTGTVKNLGDEVINVVKEYEPVLNDAFKISLTPQGDTSTVVPTNLNYNVEPQQMITNFNITPIKPVKIKDEVIKKLYRGFVKGGYGNYNTPLIEASYNSLRSKSFDVGAHFKHLSSTGKIKGYGYPGYSINKLNLTGTKFFDKSQLDGDIDYSRDVYHFYGYQSPPDMFTKNETKHLFSDVAGSFVFTDNNADKDAIKYSAGFTIYNFRDNRRSDESGEIFKGSIGKNIYDGNAKLNFIADLNQTHQNYLDYNRNIFTIEPRYRFNKDLWMLNVGVNGSLESNSSQSLYHLYPHIEAKYQVIDDQFSLFAKWTGELRRNNYRSLAKENQFMTADTILFKNTNDKLDISFGAIAKLSRDVNANASVRYSRLVNDVFFINRDELPVRFETYYDDVNLIAVHGQFDYNESEKTIIGLNIDFNSYTSDISNTKVLFKPLYRIGLTGKYMIADKIEIKPDIYFNGISYAFDYEKSVTTPVYKTIKGFVDLNIGVEYHYTKILTVFAQINNIGMSRYYYWNNYPNYRLNAMAGLTYSFW